MGHSSKREVDSNTILSQEMRKTSNNNLNYQQQIKLQLKQLQIEEQTKSMSFITENTGSQGEKAKRNNCMCLMLLKLFKWQFLKKGRKCPHCEWERREGRRARAGEQ